MQQEQQNNNYPPFSVAMCVYCKDNPQWFDAAFESIIDQTVKPDEIVLVVDGPVPNEIEDVIDKYQKLCNNSISFKVIWLEQNGGLGNALNVALQNCEHELIARMDSDDISLKDRFKQQLNILTANPQIDILGGDIAEFFDDPSHPTAYRKLPTTDSEIKELMKYRCPFNHMSVTFKKSAVQSAGGYKDLILCQDYYLWIRMMQKGCIMANTGTILVNVRTGADMYKRRGGLNYFKIGFFLQKYMLKNKIIGRTTFLLNCAKRLVVQVLLPGSARRWLYMMFVRESP
jgi:glycosyltransferase involved in cell wall biosynthesis